MTTWFAHAAPFGVLIAIFGFFVDYWVTKYILLRMCKRPENISKRIAVPMIKSLPILSLVYLCGVLQYVYKVSDSHNLFAFIFNFIDYFIVIILTVIIVISYYYLKPPPQRTLSSSRYDEI